MTAIVIMNRALTPVEVTPDLINRGIFVIIGMERQFL